MDDLMIPVDEWEWLGHAQHFIAHRDCQFRLGTRIGDYVISTVGDYLPKGAEKPEMIGFGRTFETMVFRADGGRHECGCPVVKAWRELEMEGYDDAAAATAGHIEMCLKYARKAAP